MALPKLDQLIQTHTVTLGPDLDVSFQIRPIPGAAYQAIIDAHRDEDGKTPWEVAAVPVMSAGIVAVYSSVESTPVPFSEGDAQEIWGQWPDWARWEILQTVIAATTKGPGANPFFGSKPKASAEP